MQLQDLPSSSSKCRKKNMQRKSGLGKPGITLKKNPVTNT